jgi:dipeptidyl aminopeptidase/acylaminoacyl peptidase
MLDFERQDGADSPTYRFWARTIGDPKMDAEMIKHASPALRAGELTAPVLLIHGTEDDVVPIKQSKIMQKALKTAGRDPQYVELKGESHGGWTPATWKTVLEKTGEFIAKNL